MTQKTTLPELKKVESTRKHHSIDAEGRILGRLSTEIASLLIGKHKRFYTPFIDCGDFVIVQNASKIRLTGRKEENKFYFRHSGHADGAKIIPFKRLMQKDPSKILFLAVKRMLDANKLRARRLKRLKIFAGENILCKFAKTDEIS
ncbi:MAG: 50S ribosomal protein L13 [Elusimicrobia bacterium]|nr:50S ribosomal protein L13 [Elusimicrobiota bacterium]